MDLKKGSIHKIYGEKIRIQKDDYFKFKENFDAESFKVDSNLYAIGRPKGSIETVQRIFESTEFKKFLDNLSADFDHVIIDTAPLLMTSDTMSLLNINSTKLCVLKHNSSKLRDINQLNELLELSGRELQYFVYNFFEKPSGAYGYYYDRYSYSYYSYKNSYYDQDDK